MEKYKNKKHPTVALDELTVEKIPLDVLLAKLKNLICKIAYKFAVNDMIFYEDLIFEGTCAVCEHYHEFDPSIAQASTFFYPHIKSNIYRLLQDNRPNNRKRS